MWKVTISKPLWVSTISILINTMKHTVTLLCALLITIGASAQNTKDSNPNTRPDSPKGVVEQTRCDKDCPKTSHIENMVSDLSPRQKKQLEAINEHNRPQIKAIKKDLKEVRDSIHTYMDKYGDYTSEVNRLMRREANLQYNLNKLLYATKVKCDKVLTPEQYNEFHEKQKAERTKRHTLNGPDGAATGEVRSGRHDSHPHPADKKGKPHNLQAAPQPKK